MNRLHKICLLCTLSLLMLLASCGKSPSPSPSEDEATVSPPGESAPVSGEVPSVSPSDTPISFLPLTPIPPAEDARPWPENDVVIVSAFWSENYGDGNSVYLEASASFPEFTGAPQAVADYYESIKTQFADKAAAFAQDAQRDADAGFLTEPYTLKQQFLHQCNSGGFISIQRIEELDQGGIHPEVTYYGENFRVSDGRYLTMDDFFTVPREDYLPVLMAEVVKFVEPEEDQYHANWRENLEYSFPYNSFCVTPSGLLLIFQADSIGPMAMGPRTIPVGWDVLEGILSIDDIG